MAAGFFGARHGKLVSLSVASGAALGLVALIRGRQLHTAWCRRLWALTAAEVVDLLRQDKVSPAQLIEALLVRIAATEPHINAVPTLCADRARAAARALARRGHPRNRPPGYLWGLPIVVKDLSAVAGVRWTSGSLAHAHRIAFGPSVQRIVRDDISKWLPSSPVVQKQTDEYFRM